MKANGTKRKIFNDAVDLLAGAEEVSAPRTGNEKVSSQGRRNDILEEIARLNGQDTAGTCGHDVHRLKSRDTIGEEYGMTGRNIARYMRVAEAGGAFEGAAGRGTLPLVAAVDLSYLSEKEQEVVSGLADTGKDCWMRRRRSASGAWRGM